MRGAGGYSAVPIHFEQQLIEKFSLAGRRRRRIHTIYMYNVYLCTYLIICKCVRVHRIELRCRGLNNYLSDGPRVSRQSLQCGGR